MMLVDYITDVSGLFYDIIVMMVLTNSCVNPFIYAAKYREFQRGVRRLLRKPVQPSVQPVEMQIASITGRRLNTDRRSKSVTGHSAQETRITPHVDANITDPVAVCGSEPVVHAHQASQN